MNNIRLYLYTIYTKPYGPLVFSILIFFTMRFLFIQVIYADEIDDFLIGRWSKSEQVFLEGKVPEDIHPTPLTKVPDEKDVYQDIDGTRIAFWNTQDYMNRLRIKQKLYDSFVLNPPKVYAQESIPDVMQQTSEDVIRQNLQKSFTVNPINFYAQEDIADVFCEPSVLYDKIINDFLVLLESTKGRQDFAQSCVNYVKETIDPHLLAKTEQEVVDPESLLNSYLNTFGLHRPSEISPQEYLANTLYQAAAITYNNLNLFYTVNNNLANENPQVIDEMFLQIHAKLTAANPKVHTNLINVLNKKGLLHDAIHFIRPVQK